MLLRRRFAKRVLVISIASAFLLYLSTLFFGSMHMPRIFKLTELSRCPACYGVSVCPELYSDQIVLGSWFSLSTFLNAKNIYYGQTKSGVKVVLKKLAHTSELNEFDRKLCKAWNLSDSCVPTDLLNFSNSHIEMKIRQVVKYDFMSPPLTPRTGLIFCPYEDGIMDFVKINKKRVDGKVVADKADMINVWTMLNINPEPLVLQNLPRSKGWHVPKYGGVCGRVELVSDAGAALSALYSVPWHRRLHYAKQILDAVMDFTFKHERYRFYLMDWSLDNIAVNEKDEISFVDLEDIIILDKHAQPSAHMPNWYKRYLKENSTDPSFFFSIQNICMHHLSDHNLYGACYVISGPEGLVVSQLEEYRNETKLLNLLNDCLKGKGDRFQIVTSLQIHIESLLQRVGFRLGKGNQEIPAKRSYASWR